MISRFLKDRSRKDMKSSAATSGSRETRTHKSPGRPPVFKTGSSSSRMTSVESCGSWNRTNALLVQSQVPLPTATIPPVCCSRSVGRFRGRCPIGSANVVSLPRFVSQEERPAGVEPARPPWQGDRLPLHHGRLSRCLAVAPSRYRRSTHSRWLENKKGPASLMTPGLRRGAWEFSLRHERAPMEPT